MRIPTNCEGSCRLRLSSASGHVVVKVEMIRTQDIKQREENREKYKKAEKGDHSPPTRHGKQQRRAIPECNKDHTPPTRNGE
ncbi:hypothetical protein MTR_6g091945 [Medicago truncatula]|uniref:Uncharacterized protein n=1 Tax=Medicago truncatula TaxID=3880 RepID=A0A072UCS2_MEDTR|nr:hypothetical protein MTR_6g091945 [Medicago truncatula]